jgi:hypothetical protein
MAAAGNPPTALSLADRLGCKSTVGDRVIGAFHPRWFGGEMPSTIQSDSYKTESDGWLCELKVVSQKAVVRPPRSLLYEEGSTSSCARLTTAEIMGYTRFVMPIVVQLLRTPTRGVSDIYFNKYETPVR